jgi:MFS family permease
VAASDPRAPELAEAGFGVTVARLIAGHLGTHAAMAGMRLAAPLEALRQGRSVFVVGMLIALFAVAAMLMSLWAGRWADRVGYHRPVRLAAVLTVVAGAIASASTFLPGDAAFAALCAAAALAGAGANMGSITIQRSAGLLSRDATERVRTFSWLGMAPSFANVIGPVMAGFVIDAAGFRSAYALLAVLPLAGWLVARRVPEVGGRHRSTADVNGASAWRLLNDTPGLRRLLVVNWLLSSCWDVHTFAVPILGHQRGFSASTIGLVLGAFTMSVTLVRFVLPVFAHRIREVPTLRMAMLGTALVFAAYPFAYAPWAMGACAILLGVTLGVVQPMIMSSLHQMAPEHRHGEAIALRSMAINAAGALMPLMFGAAGAWLGVSLIFWVSAAAVGAGQWVARGLSVDRLQPAG